MIRYLVAVLVAALLAGPALAAEKLKTAASAETGFARLTFELTRHTAIEARMFEGRLIVTFDRPIETDYQALVEALPGYLADAVVNPDLRSVVFGLNRPVRLRQTAGEQLHVIDLVDRADAAPAAAAETVTVRGGDHAKFGRLVFDWRRVVAFEVERVADTVEVIFAQAAELDIGSLGNYPPYGIKSMRAALQDGRARALLQIEPGARIRHFRSGTKFVLDVLPSVETPKLTEARPQPTPAPTPPSPPSAEAAAGSGGAQPLWQAQPLRQAESAGWLKVEKQPDPPASAAPAAGTPTPLAQPASATAQAKPAATPAVDKAAPADDSRKARPAEGDTPAEPAKPATDVAGSDGPGAGGLTITHAELETGGGADLAFAWPAPVPAGAFSRGRHLWLVFDRPGLADLDGIGRRESAVEAVQQMPNNRAVILRLTLGDGMHAALSRDRATWRLAVRPAVSALAAELAVLSQPFAEEGPRVFVPVVDTGQRIVVFDPEVGDELQVVPLLPSGHGVPQHRRFAEFSVLASLQGVVVQPLSELLQVLPLRNGVAVTGKQELRLSTPDLSALNQENSELSLSFKGPLLQLRSWRGDPKVPLVERRQRLQKLLARAPRGGRNVARWELARFYASHGLGAEALAVLELMQGDDEQIEQDPMFRALRAIGNLDLHRLDDAERDLLHPDLDRFPDVALWRGMLQAAQGRFADAMRAFAIGTRHLDDLNARHRETALLAWAEAAVGTDDKPAFEKAALALRALPSSPRVAGYLNLWRGTLAEADGDLAGALARYNAAVDSDYRPARASASLAAIDVALKLKRIKVDEAIVQLERLHFGWRGDDFEVRLRQRLAQLRIARNDYREGMEQLRQAMINLPDAPGMETVSKELKAVFEDLFLAGKADTLPPVEALALYYEFEELTPVGRKGDKLIGDLIDRLAAVDLLDRAERLLEHQIAYRLQGQEKSQAGARLAALYLADRQPRAALDALGKSRWQLNPAPLQAQRRHLEAKALADAGEDAKALAMLADDAGSDAGLIRADIYWKQRQWPEAAIELERLLGQRWQDQAALADDERRTVIKLAIARYLSDDSAGLATMRERYAAAMADAPEADTFALLTGEVDPSSVAFRELGRKIANLDQVDAFMASYRARHGNARTAAIN